MQRRRKEERNKNDQSTAKELYQKGRMDIIQTRKTRSKQLIHETAEYTNQRLEEVKREGIYCTYAGFLKSIKQRSKSKNRWWRRNK